jgi:glycosyltransferase involved in cell wall biosynthesis
VWVVIDASTDGSEQAALRLAETEPSLRVIVRAENGGKGAAVLDGLRLALAEGFQNALVMDADGQHPADRIAGFMHLAERHASTLILGVPQFGPEAPKARVYGRLGGNTFTEIETLWGGIRDSLFGFRVYPVEGAPLRLRHRGCGAPLLAGFPHHQYPRAGALSDAPGGRRFLFSLSAG